jgi:hypothetical protein
VFWSLPSIFPLPMHLHLWHRLLVHQVQRCVLCQTLLHEDAHSLLASDITMSFLVPVPPTASPPALPPAPTEVPPAPQPSASSPAPALASPTPAQAPAPSPGGDAAFATGPPDSSTGSSSTPSSLMALLAAKYNTLAEEYKSDKDFCWAGDKDGLPYNAPPASACKSNNLVAFYPSCNYTVGMPLFPSASSNGLPVPAALALCSILLPKHLQAIIAWMMKDSISPGLGRSFLVTDTGATDHMFPNKLACISYKSIPNLQVWIGNNSFLPVLGCGTTIISLNGQRILVCKACYMCLVSRFYSTSFAHISSNMVVDFWGPLKLGCWCISLSLFSRWTRCLTATSPINLLAGLPR